MQICFIGGGNMGTAIIKSLLSKGVAAPGDITVSDISQQRCDFLFKEYSIKTTSNNVEAVKNADVVVLAIKPQDLNNVTKELKSNLSQQLIISIIAGATLDTLKQGLDHPYLIRSMPNMPAQIGAGITVWTATNDVTPQHKEYAKSILSSSGEEIYVNSEKYIDMSTALSGSGPAYIFLVIEDKLITPPSSDNILMGITRHTVAVLAKNELGIDIEERQVDRSELYIADECFLTGTAAHITPVVEIDHRLVNEGRIGQITKQLQGLYFGVIQGSNPKYLDWCTPAYSKLAKTRSNL